MSFNIVRIFSAFYSSKIISLSYCLNNQFFISVYDDAIICVIDVSIEEINKKIKVSGNEIGNFNLPKNSKFHVEVIMTKLEFRIWKGLGD